MINPNVMETSVARFRLEENGIIRGDVFRSAPITVEAVGENITALQTLSSGIARPFLADIRSMRALPRREARQLFTRNELQESVNAVGFLINSAVGALIVEFFLRISRAPFPVKAFNDEQQAVKWLLPFVPSTIQKTK